MILGQNHHVIVPETLDIVGQVTRVRSDSLSEFSKDTIRIDLFGDDLLFGRNPDSKTPPPEKPDSFNARISTPPDELIKIFLPQFQIVTNNRAKSYSTSGNLLNGTDGINGVWPDNVQANIVIINHGLNDAKANVGIQDYKNNLIALRQGLANDQILVWQTPAETLTVNTAPYANAMIEVANQFNDIVADTRKIRNWTNELPDGEFPRQIGYSRLVDLVLSEKINSAILKHLGPDRHKFYRLDHQEKFILDEEKEITLSFRPLSASWVEVYHRQNTAYYAVSRGNVDITTNPVDNVRGHLAGGLHSVDTGDQLVSVTDGYTLIKIRREDGRVIFNRTFDINDSRNAQLLAQALNETSVDYIVIVTTYNEPKNNRLSPELKEAMFRCGASEEIFASPEFRKGSSYILIGIPGVGIGGGMEAYAGRVPDDPYAYCEIEFEIASNGVPYARDIFPPVAEIRISDYETIPLINPIYNMVAGVPPINGERILNPRYSTYKTSGIPAEVYSVIGNKIYFESNLSGVVTVVCDTQTDPSGNGTVIHLDNIQNYDRFVHRFNPGRWAPGVKTTNYPPAGTGPLDPPRVVSSTGVKSLGLYNTFLASRVGDSFYSEPFVINQPNFGYVRMTADRKKMIYVPFPNYVGPDSFSYTLMTQRGQAGITKCVYIDVTLPPPPTPVYNLIADKDEIDEGDSVTITLTTSNLLTGITTIPYVVTGITSDDIGGDPLSGNLSVGQDQVKFTTVKDMTTEGPRFLTLSLTESFPATSVTVKINDTSKTPNYVLTANVLSANEGDVVRFTLTADNSINGANVRYLIQGISSSDIVQTLTGNITLTANIGYQDIEILRDSRTEGPETMKMVIPGTAPLVSNIVAITDTSLDPTYNLQSNVNVVNEGQSVKFYLETTNVPNGTIVPYVITNIDPNDILNPMSGNLTINSNYSETVVNIQADLSNEGIEVLVFSIQGISPFGGNLISTSVLVTDSP